MIFTGYKYHLFLLYLFFIHLREYNEDSKMASRLLKTIILGPPGSGKGTISERIVHDFKLKHLSSGDLLRSHMKKETELGIEVKKHVDDGGLVPDILMIKLISTELEKLKSSNWLLDGFPRTVTQAESLHEEQPADTVINLNVPFDIIIDRIKGRWLHPGSGRIYHTEFNPPEKPGIDDVTGEPLIQREDDKEETVRRRLEHYEAQTQPVIEFYKDLGSLVEFKGNKSNVIWPKVHEYLASHIKPLQYTHYD